MTTINERIAKELNVQTTQVTAAVDLLGEGATVPFIARYRKEATGGLDDTQLRNLEERLTYLRDLEDRRVAIVASIDEQGKLTPELRAEVMNAETKQRLEDLYLPYKQKRRTKAQIAREAGLEAVFVHTGRHRGGAHGGHQAGHQGSATGGPYHAQGWQAPGNRGAEGLVHGGRRVIAHPAGTQQRV